MSDETKDLPVTTFTEAYPYLRRPFTPAAVRFKIQATWDGGAMCITYIDARLVAGRLNMVCPEIWSAEYVPHPSGKGLICHLTVGGIKRTDYGMSDHKDFDIAVKGTFSDALKRAAVQFGVGESLYVLPHMTVREGQHLKKNKKDKYLLTDAGEGHLRNVYKLWLEQGGEQAFGAPLDHGDQVYMPADEPEDVEAKPVEPIEPGPLDELVRVADGIGVPKDAREVLGKWIHESGEPDPDRIKQAVAAMNAGMVGALLTEITMDAEPVEAA